MRIMIDTNVIVSAILFPNSLPCILIKSVSSRHEIVLCTHIIEELYEMFERKFKQKTKALETFLSELAYELVYTPQNIDKDNYPIIRDEKDLPILVSAIIGIADVIITGDKDFLEADVEYPIIMTIREFVEKDSV
ncbi:MAG: putative toxin-antitoxin system toxin component, PIN family [Bacillota bacterium]|jgi:putative PIN family toxin of toxin-antitoxin system|nr:putative toxin-antitoxin system toxin component, PIN family [Bacillota bacterium]MDD3850617.1 putative toxin-antitoxin system toxin component, PIN family [Bacillota bacterium]